MKINSWVRGALIIGQKRVVWHDFKFVLLGAMLLLGLTAFGERLPALAALWVLLGLMYVFFVPGYCLTAALFPLASDLDRPARIGLSVALSVASVPIVALVLDRLHVGLYRWPILLGEYVITGISISIALWRRSRLSDVETPLGALSWRVAQWWNSLTGSQHRRYTKGALTLVAFCALATWAYVSAAPRQTTTEFYILGPGNLIQAYPYQVPLGEPVKLTVGVTNREDRPMQYHIEVWLMSGRDGGRTLVRPSQSLVLKTGQTYEQSLSWVMQQAGPDQEIELQLFRGSDPTPYRQLRIWVDVRGN